jgi:NDP-sugar pyrophosphorylase family protein
MTELIERLIRAGKTVVSFPIVEYWIDVGRAADYQQADVDLRSGDSSS